MKVEPGELLPKAQARRMDRAQHAALVAAKQAWADAGFSGRAEDNGLDPTRVAVVLGTGIEDAEGRRHAMAGLLALETSFAKRRLHIGYRRARLLDDGALGVAGTEIMGHEFHYASVLSLGDLPLVDCRDAAGEAVAEAGARRGSVSGTFFHAIDGYRS